ncbi:MAG: hypothetical protein ACP5OP_08265 [Leptospirillia bacterium]
MAPPFEIADLSIVMGGGLGVTLCSPEEAEQEAVLFVSRSRESFSDHATHAARLFRIVGKQPCAHEDTPINLLIFPPDAPETTGNRHIQPK